VVDPDAAPVDRVDDARDRMVDRHGRMAARVAGETARARTVRPRGEKPVLPARPARRDRDPGTESRKTAPGPQARAWAATRTAAGTGEAQDPARRACLAGRPVCPRADVCLAGARQMVAGRGPRVADPGVGSPDHSASAHARRVRWVRWVRPIRDRAVLHPRARPGLGARPGRQDGAPGSFRVRPCQPIPRPLDHPAARVVRGGRHRGRVGQP
jgi:hypothetical protein